MTATTPPSLPKNMLFRSHPWHGLAIGDQAPDIVNCYIEIVPTDTVKYELDKATGILKIDRPQEYSSLCPTLYGFVPRTYCGQRVADYCIQKTGRKDILGDNDPLDICVLTEKVIVRGDLIVRARPIGGFRLLDGDEADDKIIAVLMGDYVFDGIHDIGQCPKSLIERLRHYFLTYKDAPNGNTTRKVEIVHTYGQKEAYEIISLAGKDYEQLIQSMAI